MSRTEDETLVEHLALTSTASNAVVGYDRQASNANVIAIEDQNNTGLYISTGPRNFAITSTVLAKKSWSR